MDKIFVLTLRFLKESDLYHYISEFKQIPSKRISYSDAHNLIIKSTKDCFAYCAYTLHFDYDDFIFKTIAEKTSLEAFDDFLKQKHVYINFYDYKNKYKNVKHLDLIDTKYFTIAPFKWDETIEGYEFWGKIHNEWEKYVNDIFNDLINK